jgi:biotin-dependent carboxylase-like uncharacterized protein
VTVAESNGAIRGLMVRNATMLCQLQDLGRRGYQSFGVSRSGAMDRYSLRLANLLAGNPQDTACLELALAGARFELTAKSARIALVGDFPLRINGRERASNASHYLKCGDEVDIGASRGGILAYLAVAGGFHVQASMGSCSTHLRSGLGGFGFPIKSGALLPLNRSEAAAGFERYLPDPFRRSTSTRFRAVRGPQQDAFTSRGMAHFFGRPFTLARNSDRMGYRLEGNVIEHAGDGNIISDPTVPGSVQVPGGGDPIVLMADCGTSGGYPKIATVISVDLGRLAQLAPGSELRFEEISVQRSQELFREQEIQLSSLAESGYAKAY